MSRRGLVGRLLLFLSSLVLTLATVELTFWLLDVEGHYPPPRVDRIVSNLPATALEGESFHPEAAPIDCGSDCWGLPHTTVISKYGSDPRGYFAPGNEVFQVHNSVGWRDQEHGVNRTEPTFRILGLGDSYLWGQGVHQDDRVFDLLEEQLGKDEPTRAVETINTALPGMNTWWQAAVLRDKGLAYEPDLVILFFVLNDVEEDLHGGMPKIEFLTQYTDTYQTPDWLSGHSRLWSWARQRYLVTRAGRAHISDSVASFEDQAWKWQVCSGALNEIQTLLKGEEIPFLLVVFPFFYELDGDYPFAPIHDAVRRHADERGIHMLDLRDAYREFNGPELWVHETDQHPNEIAHGIAANAVYAYLKAHPELLKKDAGNGTVP